MIVSFSVVNFRSFAEEQTFSLVASKRFTGSHENHLSPIPDSDEKALRMAVIYGANGAGKSNLFKALSYVKTVALEPRKKNSGTGREVFRLDGLENYVSEFDLQFIAGNKLYRFGFKVDDNRITEEWITRVKGGRESAIYERVTNADGKVTILAKGLKKAGEKVNALATVGGLPNQSFLATVRATLDVSEYGAELDTVFKWFEDSLRLIAPNTRFGNLTQLLSNDPTFLAFASNLLKAASTGVDHLSVLKKEVSEEELRRLLPDNVVSKALSDLQETGMAMFKRTDGFELLTIEKKDVPLIYKLTLQASHVCQNGKIISMEISEESDGTRRLLNLIPALHRLKNETAVFFIDEIDRSMHPMLSWKFLDVFLKSCTQGQLIVTTHESNLLDQDLVRRDEVWFAEKDASSATRLYSLSDFGVRNDLEIRKHYLQGRFGAIPFLGDIDRLLSDKESAK